MSIKTFISIFCVVTGMIVGVGAPLSKIIQPEILYVDRPVKVEVQAAPEDYAELIKEVAPKYGVPIEVVAVLLKQEDSNQKYDYAFEPGQMARAREEIRRRGLTGMAANENQQRLFSSSFCPLQVMGYNTAKEDHPLDLLKPRVCVETAMRVIANCLQRWKDAPARQKYYKGFLCYNGGSDYADRAITLLDDYVYSRRLEQRSVSS